MEVKSKPLVLNTSLINYLILGLIAVLYVPILIHWVDGWLNKTIGIEHEYFSHALLGFPLATYIVWQKRHQWQQLPDTINPWGGVCLLIAAWSYSTGVPDFVSFSFALMLTGICLWLKGLPGLRLQAFPLVLLWLGTPNFIPYLLTPYTFWLQRFIAISIGFILYLFGFDIEVQTIYVSINGQLIEVAPYCAGLKMLFTSIYVALMLLYWRNKLNSKTITILLLTGTVLINLIGNIVRNTLLAMFSGIQQQDLFDLLHEGWWGDIYSGLTLVLIFLLLKGIERLEIS